MIQGEKQDARNSDLLSFIDGHCCERALVSLEE